MRGLFITVLVIVGFLAWLNLAFIPSRQQSAKEIVDRHINSLPITDSNEIKYVGYLKILESEAWIEDLEISAGYGKWDRTQYQDIIIYAGRINYDAKSLFWDRRRNITSIDNLRFSGVLTFDEITKRLDNSNPNMVDPVVRYDGGHLYLRAYFSPLKDKYEFDGNLTITPTGDIRYRVTKIMDVDGKDVTSRKAVNMIEDLSNLVIPIEIMNEHIALDLLDVTESGIRIAGRSGEN